ncbi:hypothetical protein KEM55_000815, partial [Ascosphaera atra]
KVAASKTGQLSHTVWQSATSDVVLVRNEVTGHIQLSNDFIPFLKEQPDGSLRSRTDKIPAGGNITYTTEIAYRAPNRPLFPRQPDIEKLVEDFKGQLVERRQRGSTVLPPLTPPLEELPEIVRYALQYPRKLLNGPQKAPDCYGCGCRAVRKKTKTNINGNRGRWFYVCANTLCPLLDTDDTFLVFDDKRGNNSTNPFCGCGKPSKLALGRPEA